MGNVNSTFRLKHRCKNISVTCWKRFLVSRLKAEISIRINKQHAGLWKELKFYCSPRDYRTFKNDRVFLFFRTSYRFAFRSLLISLLTLCCTSNDIDIDRQANNYNALTKNEVNRFSVIQHVTHSEEKQNFHWILQPQMEPVSSTRFLPAPGSWEYLLTFHYYEVIEV